jgi:hypothetical protein
MTMKNRKQNRKMMEGNSIGDASSALLHCLGGALTDRRTELAQRNRIERELKHDVGEARRNQHAEAIGVVIEIERRRRPTHRNHKRESVT